MTCLQPSALFLIASLVLAGPPAARTDDLQDIKPFCASCHGERGVSQNPLVPTLAGQPHTLIEDNLLAFRAGKRACSKEREDGSPEALLARTMCSRVAGLTDHEISALAGFYEQQAFEPADQSYDPTVVERGSRLHVEAGCERCHSEGGQTTNAMAPVLAGQWTPYLRRAMDALRSGAKLGPKMMNSAIHELEDQEVEALLNYYASQQESAASGSQR